MSQFLKIKNRRGSTLIELLVVIAIIGVLATIVLVSLNSARQKARDARRQSDMRQISLAMEMWYDTNNSSYAAPGGTSWADTFATACSGNVSTYLAPIPSDSGNKTYYCSDGGTTTDYCAFVQSEQSTTIYYLANKNGTGRRNVAPTTIATCVPNL